MGCILPFPNNHYSLTHLPPHPLSSLSPSLTLTPTLTPWSPTHSLLVSITLTRPPCGLLFAD